MFRRVVQRASGLHFLRECAYLARSVQFAALIDTLLHWHAVPDSVGWRSEQ